MGWLASKRETSKGGGILKVILAARVCMLRVLSDCVLNPSSTRISYSVFGLEKNFAPLGQGK